MDHSRFPCVYLDATYLHGRLGRNMQVVSRAVVVAIGNRYAEAQGLQRPRLTHSRRLLRSSRAWLDWNQAGDLGRPPGADGSDQADVPRQQVATCRVHFLRNLLSHVPKAGQDIVAAAM